VSTSGPFDLSTRRVIYDVNVYLDVAEQLGPAFAWESLPPLTSVRSHPHLGAQFALSIAREAHFAGPLPLELWTSTHITDLLLRKLSSILAWKRDDAEWFTQEMLDEAYRSKGAELSVHIARQSPPLDHEDGLVFATAVAAHADYLVTSDKDFTPVDQRNGVYVMTPHDWACYVQNWRDQARRSGPPS